MYASLNIPMLLNVFNRRDLRDKEGSMRRKLRENGLSLVLFGMFLLILIGGQVTTGHQEYNDEQQEHGQPPIGFLAYMGSSHFLEATMENWESEFLQMFIYVVLTIFLYQ